MSSSWRLTLREKGGYNFGPYYNHYITHKECHPDYKAYAFGHPDGVRVCIKDTVEKKDAVKRPAYQACPTKPRSSFQVDYGRENMDYNKTHDYSFRHVVYDGIGLHMKQNCPRDLKRVYE